MIAFTGIILRPLGRFQPSTSRRRRLPAGQQVDIRPVRDLTRCSHPQPSHNPQDGPLARHIVVSRRAVLEESRAEQRWSWSPHPPPRSRKARYSPAWSITKITDYGAFRRSRRRRTGCCTSAAAWAAHSHEPSVRGAAYRQTVKVQYPLQFRDPSASRSAEAARGRSVGGRRAQIPGQSVKGRSPTSPTTARFVELEPASRGSRPRLGMSWTKQNVHPCNIVSTIQEGRGHGPRCSTRKKAAHQPSASSLPWRNPGAPCFEHSRPAPSSRARSRHHRCSASFVRLPG